jgi:uncharacterized lipoprotein YajG
MTRISLALVIAALLTLAGCQKEVREIRSNPSADLLASR